MDHAQPSTHRTALAERLLDLADEIRAQALELLKLRTADDFDARVSELLDRVIADEESRR